MSDFEIGWIAGLFEGEGNIFCGFQPNPKTQKPYLMRSVSVSSTDRDVLEKLHAIVGFGVIRGPYKNGNRKSKPIYRWQALGYGEMKRFLALVYQHLGPRRQAQAHVLLANPPLPTGFRYTAEKLAAFDAIEVPGWTPPRRTGIVATDLARGILQ